MQTQAQGAVLEDGEMFRLLTHGFAFARFQRDTNGTQAQGNGNIEYGNGKKPWKSEYFHYSEPASYANSGNQTFKSLSSF